MIKCKLLQSTGAVIKHDEMCCPLTVNYTGRNLSPSILHCVHWSLTFAIHLPCVHVNSDTTNKDIHLGEQVCGWMVGWLDNDNGEGTPTTVHYILPNCPHSTNDTHAFFVIISISAAPSANNGNPGGLSTRVTMSDNGGTQSRHFFCAYHKHTRGTYYSVSFFWVVWIKNWDL